MSSVRRHGFIECDADTVWRFISKMDNLHEWFPVVSTKVEGSKRWIQLANGITFEEDILLVDHDLRRYQYSIVPNAIIKSHLATVDVIPDGDSRCVIVYSTDMDPEVLALPIAGAAGEGIARLAERFERKK